MTINLKGELIDLLKPKVMGILNLTPDSFYDGGQFNVLDRALEQTEKMIYEGAFFIDLGACSTKPGVKEISEDDARHAEEQIQKLTNNYIEKVEQELVSKEADLMKV